MNRDDVIRMTRQAGMQGMLTDVVCTHDELERFAALVAAAEREECAKVCESRRTPGTGSVAILNGAADAIRARGQQ